jgi:hypothetical protein
MEQLKSKLKKEAGLVIVGIMGRAGVEPAAHEFSVFLFPHLYQC